MDDSISPITQGSVPTNDQSTYADQGSSGSSGDTTYVPERVFDITPDMNITPVSEVSDEQPAFVPDYQNTQTQPGSVVDRNPPPKKSINLLEETPPIVKSEIQPARPTVDTQTTSIPVPEQPQSTISEQQKSLGSVEQSETGQNTKSQSFGDAISEQAGAQSSSPISLPSQRDAQSKDDAGKMIVGQEKDMPSSAPVQTEKVNPFEPANKGNLPVGATGSEKAQVQDVDAKKELLKNIPKSPYLKPLRTYEGDVAEVMSHRQTSVASIAIAESKKMESEGNVIGGKPESSHSIKKIVIVLLSLIIIAVGVGGAYYLYSKSPLAKQGPVAAVQPQAPSSIIPRESYVVIPVDNIGAAAIISQIQAEMGKSQAPNTVKEIILAVSNGNQKFRIGTADLLNKLSLVPPDSLTRTLTNDWMLGVFSDSTGNKHLFVISTTDYFQDAFSGMLQWEKVMADDLRLYITSPAIKGIANAPGQTVPNNLISATTSIVTASTTTKPANATSSKTSTTSSKTKKPGPKANIAATSTSNIATTTIAIEPAFTNSSLTLDGQFQDRIIMNKDVRAFVTSHGQTLFLYSFIDNEHLVFAGDESAISEILTRLEKQTFIR